jgi:hypothetical protein
LGNSGDVTITGITNGDSLSLENQGSITITGAIKSGNDTITIAAHSPLTINNGVEITGNGNVSLSAGPSFLPNDNMLVNGNITSLNQDIILKAGGAITINGQLSAPNGKIFIEQNLNNPLAASLPEVAKVINSSLATMGNEASDLSYENNLGDIEPSEGDNHGTEFRALPYCN